MANFMNWKSLWNKLPRAKKFFLPSIESLEERIECATRVWDGSQIPNGSDGPPPVNGDPTFSSILNSARASNWALLNGQPGILPQNGDTLYFGTQANPLVLVTPTAGVFGNLTRPDPNGATYPIPISVNVINDLSLDSNGNMASYIPNGVNPLTYVNEIDFLNTGYYLFGRDYPQFGPALGVVSGGPQLSFYPGTGVTANPLNVRTQLVANYAGDPSFYPSNQNANWIYMPTQVGNGNSDFVFNVAQEGSWLIFSNRINDGMDAGYTSISDVSNNKIIKQGDGVLVFDGKNTYRGITLVQDGMLIVSHDQGLGDPTVNANVEVAGGTVRLSSSNYSQNAIGNIFSGGTQVSNRNLVLYGGDGFIPTMGSAGINLGIPQGQLDGASATFNNPNQWNGTITLIANPGAPTVTGAPNLNGDPSVGQQFGSTMELNGVISGAAGLRKWGLGTVELTQANTFTGDLNVFNGFLNLQNNQALGLLSGGALVKNVTVAQLPTNLLDPLNPTAQYGALTIGDTVVGGQSFTFGPQYNLAIQGGNGPDQNPGAPFTNSQRVEGLGAFQIISPANNPNFADWQGNVVVQDTASIGGSPGGTLKISGFVSLNQDDTLEKRGSNTLELSSSNPNLLGNILVSSGNLRLTNALALKNAASVSVTQTNNTLPLLSGAGSIQVQGTNLTFSNPITLASTGFNGLGGLQSIGSNTWSGEITIDKTSSLSANSGNELTILGNITQNANAINSKSQLIKIGAGTVKISGPTTLSLPVSVQEGTLLIQNNNSLGTGAGGTITVSTSGSTGPATLAIQNSITVGNRTLSLDGTGVGGVGALRSLSGSNTWTSNITLAGTSQTSSIGVDQDTLVVSGKIDGGSTILRKDGAGTLVITGSGNTQASTLVNGGSLIQLGSDNVPVSIQSGSLFQGTGKSGNVTINFGQAGVVNAGVGSKNVGILNTGAFTLASSSGVLGVDLNSQANGAPAAGNDYDQINVQGNVLLTNNPALSLSVNFNPTLIGTKYTIINNDGSDAVVGTFAGLAEGATVSNNNYSYRISYVGGDGNDVTLTALGILTTTTISSSDLDNLTTYGQAVTFTALVTAPTGVVSGGTVQFFNNGVAMGAPLVVGSGNASYQTTTLNVPSSPHAITATYTGIGVIAGSNSANTINHLVNQATSSIGVNAPVSTYGTGLDLTFTATVTPQFAGGSPTGSVIFEVDGVPQSAVSINTNSTDPVTGSRTATFTTNFAFAGNHVIRASYLGDGNFQTSGFSAPFSESILVTHGTTATITSSESPVAIGKAVTFTANLVATNPLDGDPIGAVTFYDGSTAISPPLALFNGQTTFQTSSLQPGRRTIRAVYAGSANAGNTFFFQPNQASLIEIVGANGGNLIIVGANSGGGPQVNVYDKLTGAQTNFFAFDPAFRGGVRVAGGDVTGDGVEDVIVAAGPGGGPNVKVFDGANNYTEIRNFFAYSPFFSSGIFVASGDVNGDGYSDIITGAGAGGGPHVQVFSGFDNSILATYFAYAPTFTGGISVASGDLNADGYSDVITGAGPGGGPHVLALNGLALVQGSQVVMANFFAYDPAVRQGIFVASGDYDGNGFADIIVGAGPGGGPHVKVFDPSGTNTIDSFFAYSLGVSGGVCVGASDINNDGRVEVLTVPYTKAPSDVKAFAFARGVVDDFFAFPPAFSGGAFVA